MGKAGRGSVLRSQLLILFHKLQIDFGREFGHSASPTKEACTSILIAWSIETGLGEWDCGDVVMERDDLDFSEKNDNSFGLYIFSSGNRSVVKISYLVD